MKKLIFAFIILILLIGYVILFPKKEKGISLGVLIPLTGNGSDQGEWIKRGFDLALKDLNEKEEMYIKLVYEDTKGDPKNAISAYNQLKTRFKMPAIFSWGSGVGIALTPGINNDKVIQMGVATAADSYTTPEDYSFRVFPSASQEGSFLANAILSQLKINSVVVLNVNNDYGVSSAQAFKDSYKRAGGTIITSESYDVATTDFHTILTKIKNLSPEIIYIASYPTDGALLLKQASDLGIKSQFIASTAILGGKDFFKIAGNSAEGLIVSNSSPVYDENSSPAQKRFAEIYQSQYNESLGPQQLYSARAYDALNIVGEALNACGVDTDCVKEHLFKTENYSGASGIITFNRDGDISSDFNLQVIKSGNFEKFR